MAGKGGPEEVKDRKMTRFPGKGRGEKEMEND